MSVVRYGVAVNRPSVKVLVTGEDVISGKISVERFVREAKVLSSRFLEILKNNTWSVEGGNEVADKEERQRVQELLKNTLLPAWPSFLKTFTESRRVRELSSYMVFLFNLLHSIHLLNLQVG